MNYSTYLSKCDMHIRYGVQSSVVRVSTNCKLQFIYCPEEFTVVELTCCSWSQHSPTHKGLGLRSSYDTCMIDSVLGLQV